MKNKQKRIVFELDTILTQAEVDDIAKKFAELATERGYSVIEFIAAILCGEITLLIMGDEERNEAIRLLEKEDNRTLSLIARELKASREMEEYIEVDTE